MKYKKEYSVSEDGLTYRTDDPRKAFYASETMRGAISRKLGNIIQTQKKFTAFWFIVSLIEFLVILFK